MTGSRHQRLADLMEERRLELDMKWDEVAAAARIKPPTLRAIRNGTNRPSALTRRGIDRALGWETGSVEAILAGGDPTVREARPVRPAEREQPGAGGEDQSVMAELADAVERDPELARMILEIYRRGVRDGADGNDGPPQNQASGTA